MYFIGLLDNNQSRALALEYGSKVISYLLLQGQQQRWQIIWLPHLTA